MSEMVNNVRNDALIAHYKFDDVSNIGKDSSANGMDAVCMGNVLPTIKEVDGRLALHLEGGPHGTCYMKLPENLLSEVDDNGGLTIAAWVNLDTGHNVWERIIDFGSAPGQPNIFLTRGMRGVVFAEGDIAADPAKALPVSEWVHIAFTIAGTRTGTLSSAGPVVYVNGEVVNSGLISQTTSGTYGRLRRFFETFKDAANYPTNTIGCSKFDADGDLHGNISDMRIYKTDLSEDEIIDVMCGSLSDEEIVNLALNKYLIAPNKLISDDITLDTSIMKGKVNVVWTTDRPDVLSETGKMMDIKEAYVATLTATVKVGDASASRSFKITVVPKSIAPYELTINANEKVCDISETLWGLFYEDINNAADGGIYAELIQNRSFEAFYFDTYDRRSGENGTSTGRVHTPLFRWFGDTDKMTPVCEGGLNDFFGIDDKEANGYYVNVASGATIINKGFCDNNNYCSIKIDENDKYDFTIWAKSANGGTITVSLTDEDGNAVSDSATITVEAGNTWKKYGVDSKVVLTATKSLLGQFKMVFDGDISIDMVSLYPEKVWGATAESTSATANANYNGNPNYRLRKDLVEALVGLHPTFLRFPGGCISEGSYIWDNVYDWKDSVGDVEIRKENFNVWGYNMTMGLGYMEYFQLAEDLNATPLPVMACGVLCQARSDYANPAGGALQEKYIKNFTDLIDFAINTDFENNEWAALRKKMGHEAPFDLHYLGVGNENWGPEFMASFEIFYERITKYVKENYPGYPLYIISTVGAQADDDAYKFGWKFLAGDMKGTAKVAFTDGVTSTEEEVSWYKYQKHFMETIADEHYYRPNHYLLNNADRYNYYYRAYNADGTIDDNESSKVFVGEYASNEKNTLAGAVAEAAVMTGFENNSDVVRLAATAPLFNKVLTDNLYRWTPDCIWFDNETVWYTPTYYVQQLFAKYIGKKAVQTSFKVYQDGVLTDLIPRGGIEIATGNAEILVKSVKVTSNVDNSVLLEHDFANGMISGFEVLSHGEVTFSAEGMTIKGDSSEKLAGIYCIKPEWTNYKVEVVAKKLSGFDGFYVGALVTNMTNAKNCIEYSIGFASDQTGVKVYKEGIEGYKLGDFASSHMAGNLRNAAYENVELNKDYTITVDCGAATGKNLVCSYTDGSWNSKVLDYKLEAYNKEVFNSVTVDDNAAYIKLVNADTYTKNTKLIVKDMDIASEAKVVTITAAPEYANVQNVNKRGNEVVVPVESTVTFENGEAVVTLPAHSVVAVIVNKK
ncbi:MAG: alpha-L-arabinofuranosidase [Lachnospiraceae bacterium]|nr:alpha-L-arabinofuranosidase [Lachnospiraceae bacterium]